jgi:hypothetical protein
MTAYVTWVNTTRIHYSVDGYNADRLVETGEFAGISTVGLYAIDVRRRGDQRTVGSLTDVYDLFVIGADLTILTSEWHVSGFEKSAVSSAALFAAVIGDFAFWRLVTEWDAKSVYCWEMARPGGSRDRIGVLAQHLLVDRLAHGVRHRHRGQLSRQRH